MKSRVIKKIAKEKFSQRTLIIGIKFIKLIYTIYGKLIKNRIKMYLNSKKAQRFLEIGCGDSRIPGFETLDIVGGPNVDYVYDASKSYLLRIIHSISFTLATLLNIFLGTKQRRF